MFRLPKKLNGEGQALIIVLLSLAVVLTIVLYVLSRSITDVSISSRSEDSLRAFSAAEAGVERALIAGSSNSDSFGNASFNASVADVALGAKFFNYPLPLTSGNSATLFFASHDKNGDLTCVDGKCFTGNSVKFCWGNSGTTASSDTTPAIEATIYYAVNPGDYSTVRIARAAIDPNASRRVSNSFAEPDVGTCNIEGEGYMFQKTLSFADLNIPASSYRFQNGLQFARLRVLYNTDLEHKVGFSVDMEGNSILPSQGVRIESLGTSGEANRKVEVFQGWGETPQVFDSVVFSGNGVVGTIR